MAQVIFYAIFILSTCICLMHCRSLQTEKRSPKYLDLKQTGRNAQLWPTQEKIVKRVKRYSSGQATTIDPTAAPETPSPYMQVIPFVNTGSSYLSGAYTKVAAAVYNYGFYNYPSFLGPDYNKPLPVQVDNYEGDDEEDYEDPEDEP